MFRPSIRKKRSGVPVLSHEDIETIAEGMLKDYCPQVLQVPQELDIDLFAQEYLGADQDFQYLSHNGIYLGMTVFNDTDRVVIFDPTTGRAEYLSANARTIIIDNRLLEPDQEHRYRFTMGHESGHLYLHPDYYTTTPGQMTLDMFMDTDPRPAMVRCREDAYRMDQRVSVWNEQNTMEWQANALSAALLMPRAMVRLIAEEGESFYRWDLDLTNCIIEDMIRTFNVSREAAAYRLKDLGLLQTGRFIGRCAESKQMGLEDII